MLTLIELECESCGKLFTRSKAQAKNARSYCSRACVHANNRITKPCDNCGKPITFAKSRLKAQATHYCSKKCGREFRMRKGEMRACPVCKKSFWVAGCNKEERRYCSWACYASVQGDGRRKGVKRSAETCKKISIARTGKPVPARRKPPVKLICEQCKNTFVVINAPSVSAVRRFCSTSCWYSHCHEHPEATGRFIDNRAQTKYAAAWRGRNWQQQKRKVLKRDNFTCVECRRPWPKVRIAVHHKRAFKLFKHNWRKANQVSNLIVLCARCHKKYH